MRVRILRQVYLESTHGAHMPGDVLDLPDDQAESLASVGVVMQDKSLDGASETKSGLYWCNKCGCSHRNDSEIGIRHRRGDGGSQ